MNDIYGIDPCAPSSLMDLSALMRKFGPAEGRFIAEFPMSWRNDLNEHMRRISDISQMAMTEAWIRLSKHAVLPVKSGFNRGRSWEENAVVLADEVVKLIGPAGRPANVVHPIDQVLVDPNAFPDARGAHIPRTVKAYLNAIGPILRSSPKVVLIDPYFALSYRDKSTGRWRPDRRSKFISALLKFAVEARRVECFEIFTDPSKSFDTRINLDELMEVAETVGASGMQLRVNSIDRFSPIGRHARYILGMVAGIHFDYGFDLADDGSTNHVEWIGESALRPLLERFT